MSNHIREICIVNRRLDPTETVLNIHLELAELTRTTEIRGRLTGPCCVYSSTIEIAYELREIERTDQVVLLEAVIPEPSWWDPESPFVYEGRLELWQDGQSCERMRICHAICWLQLTSKGLRLNGHPFFLRAKVIAPSCTDADMRQLHVYGFNAVVTTPAAIQADLRSMGDRFGLFVSYDWNDEPFSATRIVPSMNILVDSGLHNGSARKANNESSNLLIPPNASVVICRESELARAGSAIPKIVYAERIPDILPELPGVIGWIESAL